MSLGPDYVSKVEDDSFLDDVLHTPRTLGFGASASIGGQEPMGPGETLVLDWPAPSAKAELMVDAFTPLGERSVVLRLFWRPEHVEVTNRLDGTLEVRTPGRTDVVPLPAPPAPASSLWQPRSAREAAERLFWMLDHPSFPDLLRGLCAALHPDVYAAYGGARQVREASEQQEGSFCETAMFFQAFGLDNVPEILSSRHGPLAVRISGRRAIVSTTITNRFREDGDVDVERVTLRARILLVKDDGGMWRLGSFDAILPLQTFQSRRRYDDASLLRAYRASRREAAAAQARFDRGMAETAARTVIAGSTAPCVPGWRLDRAGDVTISTSSQAPRRPEEHLDVDLVGGAFGGRCLRVRTSGVLPELFTIDLGTLNDSHQIAVDRTAKTVIVVNSHGDDEEPQVPLGGVSASLSDHELIVRFPRSLPLGSTPPRVRISTTRGETDYADVLGNG